MSDENQNNTNNANKNAFDCLRAIEDAFPNNERFTIGDYTPSFRSFPGGVSGLRRTVFICASKVDALVETTTTTAAKTTTMKEQQQQQREEDKVKEEEETKNTRWCFPSPRHCRSVYMARDAAFRASLLRRRTFRAFYTFSAREF